MIKRNFGIALLIGATAMLGCSDDESGNNANNTNNVNNTNNSNNSNNVNNSNNSNNSNNMLPPDFRIEGLTSPADVHVDEHGMTHIQCDTDLDCVAVQGYMHAYHRFAQMELRRRLARGQVSEVAGEIALDFDRASRTRFMTGEGEYLEDAWYRKSSPLAKSYLEAYASGVNTFIDDLQAGRNGAKVSTELTSPLITFDLENMRDWEPQDSVGCGVLLIDDLSNRAGSDIARGEWVAAGMTADQLFDIQGQMTGVPINTIETSGESYPTNTLLGWPDASQMEPAIQRLRMHGSVLQRANEQFKLSELFYKGEDPAASNNWVIGPSKSATGKAMLANDPHLSLTNPSLWYLVSLDSKSSGSGDLNVRGVSFAGIPGILLGHNEDIAWGATVVGYDISDAYVETLNATDDAVMFNNAEVPITEVMHTYNVLVDDTVEQRTETIRVVPHHGPILVWDPDTDTAISYKWSGLDVDNDFDAFYGLALASNMAEAKTALENATSTNQNFVVIDRQDNIGWFPYTRVPIRPWASLAAPPWLPLNGDGTQEWSGYMDYADLPQMENPTNGYIITANQDMSGALADGDPTNDGYNMLQSYAETGWRQNQINVRFQAKAMLNADDMRFIQMDNTMFIGNQIAPAVAGYITNATLDQDSQQIADILDGWNGGCPTGVDGIDLEDPDSSDATEASESIGCTVFHVFMHELAAAAFADELMGTGAGIGTSAYNALSILISDSTRLQGGDAYWDNTSTDGPPETADMIVVDALAATAARMESEFGADTNDWRWGRIHNLSLTADLYSNFVESFNNGPYSTPGGWGTVNVARPASLGSSNYRHPAGASMRLVVENTDAGFKSWMTLPGGNQHFRRTPFYDNLLEGWILGNHFQMKTDATDIADTAVETLNFNTPE